MNRSIIILIVLQIVAALAMTFGFVEREAGFFVTALMALFMALRPLEEGTELYVLSVPWFFALPFNESFDSMSSWRILSAILFLRYLGERLYGAANSRAGRIVSPVWSLIRKWSASPLFRLIAAFLVSGLISSLLAPYPAVGIKKVVFLLNIFLLYPVVGYVAKKKGIGWALKTISWSVAATIAIGFAQLGSIFFISLNSFWRFWASHVIPVFYGYGLGELLQTSNTWFSFGGGGPPLLRMFSVFPDSHSFAMFVMLGLIALCALWLSRNLSSRLNLSWHLFGVLVAFFALIFSGSRGVWLSAMGIGCILAAALWLLRGKMHMAGARSHVKKLFASFLVFGILFFPASLVSYFSQRAQGLKADSFAELKRVKSITDLDETSNRSRLQIWVKALETIRAYPFFGIGFGNFSVALGESIGASRRGASAHNLYLDIAGEAGLPTLGLFLAMVIYTLRRVIKDIFMIGENNAIRAALSSTFLIYILWILGYSFFDVVLFNDKVLMLATFLCALALGGSQTASREEVETF